MAFKYLKLGIVKVLHVVFWITVFFGWILKLIQELLLKIINSMLKEPIQ